MFNETINYKNRKFKLYEKDNKKCILFLLDSKDKKLLTISNNNYQKAVNNILEEFLNDEDFIIIIRLKFFGFTDDMYGYTVPKKEIEIYNGIAFIRNFK